jgi:hypothetical protein
MIDSHHRRRSGPGAITTKGGEVSGLDMHVYAVHATKPDDGGVLEVIWQSERQARRYAAERSTDLHVLATAVTRYQLDVLGTRTSIAWYIKGVEQPISERRPGRLYPGAPGDETA